MPKSRTDFWHDKLKANRLWDERPQSLLREMNWRVLIVWECQMKARDLTGLANTIRQFLDLEVEVNANEID